MIYRNAIRLPTTTPPLWIRVLAYVIIVPVALYLAIADGFRWLWRVFLCEFIFCVVFMILVAFLWLAIGYRGWL